MFDDLELRKLLIIRISEYDVGRHVVRGTNQQLV